MFLLITFLAILIIGIILIIINHFKSATVLELIGCLFIIIGIISTILASTCAISAVCYETSEKAIFINYCNELLAETVIAQTEPGYNSVAINNLNKEIREVNMKIRSAQYWSKNPWTNIYNYSFYNELTTIPLVTLKTE